MIEFLQTVRRPAVRSCAGAFAAFLALAVASAPALAQDEPAGGFDTIESCTSFATELAAVNEEAETLDTQLATKVTSQNELLAAIFEGTQILLGYGEKMFEASDEHEEKCKSALREAGKGEEILRIYELVLEPTMRGYAFLGRVRDNAEELGETQTVEDMDEAIAGYAASARKLAEFCKDDLPEDVAEKRCAEFAKRIDAAMR